MNRQTADRLVAALVFGILAIGSYATLRAYWQVRTAEGMMGDMMRTMPGADPVWYAFGTLIAISAVLGTYAIARESFTTVSSTLTDTDGDHQSTSDSVQQPSESESESTSGSRAPELLEVLPEDERRVLEPLLESPGLTQVELRARSDFSKAKVSQTVTELEDRGLLYREKQGRTYRVYPGERLTDHERE